MADPQEKPRPWWQRALAWLGVELAKHTVSYIVGLLTVGVGAAWLLGSLTGLGKLLVSERVISAWALFAVDTIAVVFVVVSVGLAFYIRKLDRALTAKRAAVSQVTRPAFEPIQVDDERLKIRWTIRQRPDLWLGYQGIQQRLAHSAVQDILDGPFHAVCLERLDEYRSGYGGGHSSPILRENCPSCGAKIFTSPRRNLEQTFAHSWTVRAQAVEELQRMRRSGTLIEGPRLVLERPLYWGDMHPAK